MRREVLNIDDGGCFADFLADFGLSSQEMIFRASFSERPVTSSDSPVTAKWPAGFA